MNVIGFVLPAAGAATADVLLEGPFLPNGVAFRDTLRTSPRSTGF
jgi:hypothetical protein